MIAELLFIAAMTAGWAWLQYAGEVSSHRGRQRRPIDVVR